MSRFELAAETRSSHGLRRRLVRFALAAAAVSALAACSAVPSSMKPDEVYGEAKPAPTPEGTTGFPELANVPDKKPEVTSTDDQKAIAESLAKDRAASREGDKELRDGGMLPPPAKGTEVKTPDESMMQPDATDMTPAVAAEPARVETPAPVAANDPAPAVAPVAAPASKVSENEPVKQAEAAPMPKPAAPAAPAAPAPAPGSADVAPPPPVAAASAAEPAAAPAEETGALAGETAEPAKPALQLPPGVIAMPPRGGHASFADILTPEQKAARKKAAEEEAKNAAEGDGEGDDSGEVNSAPTQPVEVQPVPDTQ